MDKKPQTPKEAVREYIRTHMPPFPMFKAFTLEEAIPIFNKRTEFLQVWAEDIRYADYDRWACLVYHDNGSLFLVDEGWFACIHEKRDNWLRMLF